MNILAENDYEPSITNLLVLKEGLASGEIVFEELEAEGTEDREPKEATAVQMEVEPVGTDECKEVEDIDETVNEEATFKTKKITTLKEAFEAGSTYYSTPERIQELQEMIAVSLAKENNDILFQEMAKCTQLAESFKNRLLHKYSIISENRTAEFLQSILESEACMNAVKDEMPEEVDADKLNVSPAGSEDEKKAEDIDVESLEESLTDFELLKVLDESGYEPSLENLSILKEYLLNEKTTAKNIGRAALIAAGLGAAALGGAGTDVAHNVKDLSDINHNITQQQEVHDSVAKKHDDGIAVLNSDKENIEAKNKKELESLTSKLNAEKQKISDYEDKLGDSEEVAVKNKDGSTITYNVSGLNKLKQDYATSDLHQKISDQTEKNKKDSEDADAKINKANADKQSELKPYTDKIEELETEADKKRNDAIKHGGIGGIAGATGLTAAALLKKKENKTLKKEKQDIADASYARGKKGE